MIIDGRDKLPAYAIAQVIGGYLGSVVATVMFELNAIAFSSNVRSSGALWASEVVATAGLLLVIFGIVRSGKSAMVLFAREDCGGQQDDRVGSVVVAASAAEHGARHAMFAMNEMPVATDDEDVADADMGEFVREDAAYLFPVHAAIRPLVITTAA